ncbi:unnamed protein product [Pleuronectes platessa]|uniref:THAP-type domain-containing protein n=1 Tax=Pleuronectes platessa TaxID=8262 RepID=A0A9N7Y7T1_PLEPL|nr:unnamed protein product [Pleuronectes platessa]
MRKLQFLSSQLEGNILNHMPSLKVTPPSVDHLRSFTLGDLERLDLWVINMKRQNWIPNENLRLCGQHFERQHFSINRCDSDILHQWMSNMRRQNRTPTRLNTKCHHLCTDSSQERGGVSTGKMAPGGTPPTSLILTLQKPMGDVMDPPSIYIYSLWFLPWFP